MFIDNSLFASNGYKTYRKTSKTLIRTNYAIR